MGIELPILTLNKKQKDFVKSKLLEITSLLEFWRDKYNAKYKPKKLITNGKIKKLILEGTLEEEFPDIIEAKSKLKSFSNDHLEPIGGPLEYVILCSFSAKCISIARNRSRKISAELNINADSVYEDLLQDAYVSVQHSMYYFTKSNRELSTYIINSLARKIEYCSRYRYCKLSAMNAQDVIDTYRCRIITMENPSFTVQDIAEEMGVDHARADQILCSMSQIVRIQNKKINQNSEASFDLIAQIPDKRSSLEDSDNIDTVEFLKKIFDETDQSILSLTREERDVLHAACTHNFERGWQSKFANQYINQVTGKPYSRARIGQMFSSAIEKVKAFFAEAA